MRVAISTMMWRPGSSPVISRSIQASTSANVTQIECRLIRVGTLGGCSRSRSCSSTTTCARPSYARAGDAGADLAARTGAVVAAGGGRALVPTGVRVAIPEGYAGFVQPRSGLAWRHGITLANSPGSHRCRLPRRDRGDRDQHRPVERFRDPARRPHRPAGGATGGAGVVPAGGGACQRRIAASAASGTRDGKAVPELPEVEALTRFLGEKCTGQVIERVEVAALSALKTYAPPIDALRGQEVAGAARRGKYVGLRAGALWLVMHLARGGWVQWRDVAPAGSGPARQRAAGAAGRAVRRRWFRRHRAGHGEAPGAMGRRRPG